MEIIEAYVTKKNLTDMYYIIENTLLARPNTQVFIDNEIYDKLKSPHGVEYHVFSPNMVKTWHYNVDNDNFGGETWLNLTDGCADKSLFKASFIANCRNYYQLVEFYSEKMKDQYKECGSTRSYTHFMVDFDNLLLIHFK